MPPRPAPAPAPGPPRPKAVTFCARCEHRPAAGPPAGPPADPDERYHSDPGGREDALKAKRKKPKERRDPGDDGDLRYHSEPDAGNYFEIDYGFLRELRRIARSNCPECERKRARRDARNRRETERARDSYVYCDGRYHGAAEHCQLCCRTCGRSSDTLASVDDDLGSMTSRSYDRDKRKTERARDGYVLCDGRSHGAAEHCQLCCRTCGRSTDTLASVGDDDLCSTASRSRGKSVSFQRSSTSNESGVEPNYTAKSFTNDLKRFLLGPPPPPPRARLRLRDKLIGGIKQELGAPRLKAIKGLWKSY